MMKALLTKRSGRILITSFLVLQMMLGYVGQMSLVHAQIPDALNVKNSGPVEVPEYGGVEDSIKQYLCVPDSSNLGTALYTCVTKLYRFGIAFGAIALVFFVVFAGYVYITGGEAAKEKGKGIILSAVTGMAIILSSYVLLSFINPYLVKIRPIQPPIFSASNLPKCDVVGLGVNCILPTGQVNYPGGSGVPGSASEAKYKDLIAKYATQNGLKYCAMSALIEQESHFSETVYSSPDYVIRHVDLSKGPPSYGVVYNTYHAIGLTQITIYPKNKGGWVGDTPARSAQTSFGTSPLTMEMLLNPETNIKAGAFYFGKIFKKDQDINKAYGHYFNGEGSNAPAPVDLTKKYNACLLRG